MSIARCRHVLLGALLLAGTPLGAQDPADREERCRAAVTPRFEAGSDSSSGSCLRLARHVADALSTRFTRRPSQPQPQAAPRDLQSRASGNSGGSTGSEAVSTVQPTALAAGTLGALGSGGGADGIAAISLNPWTLLGGTAPSSARKFDITLLTPTGNDTDSLRYLGVRMRVNFESAAQSLILDRAEALFRQKVVMSLQLQRELETLFAKTPDPEACTAALVDADPGDDTSDACGDPFDVAAYDVSAAAFRRYTTDIREKLDANYFGLDLRYDRGDPTFGAVPGLDGTFIYAGVALGRRIGQARANGSTVGWRFRLGAQHITVDSGAVIDSLANGVSVDGAFAFEATYPSAFRPIRIIGGLEYRSGGPLPTTVDDALELEGLRWRLSIDIPVTDANGIAIAYATPLTGGGRPTLNVSFNWQMLLQKTVP